ncbi:MAG: lysophospholipid acyltransferase family protein [Anaerolineae bacterium]|nr:lysophospholipid acyltransferase family protein [Anaerolineae bacterium]
MSWIARFILWIFGWRIESQPIPNYPKMVMIGAPHTSNLDGFLYILIVLGVRVRANFLAKHSLFRPPFGWLLRLAGGVPLNRTTTVNAVEQAVQVFRERDRMVLALAPEGTRKNVPYWKTGFYYIALGAGVPIVLGYVDYRQRRCGFGPMLMPSGDIDKDFEVIRAFYADKVGQHPERQGPIALPPKE